MKILGINTGHDSGAAIIDDGKIAAAVNEERYSRIKMHWGLPKRSIARVFEISGIKPGEIDYAAVAGITAGGGINPDFRKARPLRGFVEALSFLPFFKSRIVRNIYQAFFSKLREDKALSGYLIESGVNAPVKFIEHHLCHAAAAYYTSQYKNEDSDKVMIATVDGAGDGLCSTISSVEDGRIKRLHQTHFFNTPTAPYSYVTHNLGFKYLHHEGKITGLAAYGNRKKQSKRSER